MMIGMAAHQPQSEANATKLSKAKFFEPNPPITNSLIWTGMNNCHCIVEWFSVGRWEAFLDSTVSAESV